MKCTICNHPNRLEIEQDMKSNSMNQSEIAKKYNLYPQVVANHTPHIAYDIRGRLEQLIKESLESKQETKNIGDLARLLSEYRAFAALEDKCISCPRNKSTKTIGEVFADILEYEITPEEGEKYYHDRGIKISGEDGTKWDKQQPAHVIPEKLFDVVVSGGDTKKNIVIIPHPKPTEEDFQPYKPFSNVDVKPKDDPDVVPSDGDTKKNIEGKKWNPSTGRYEV